MTLRSDGYVVVRVGQRVRLAHRIVMEGLLGRPLLSEEHVHHRNGDRADNRPENLEVLSRAEHMAKHRRATCKHGHKLEGENIYIRPDDGTRQCKACKRETLRRFRRRALAKEAA